MNTQTYRVREASPDRMAMYDGVFDPSAPEAVPMCRLMQKYGREPRLYTGGELKANIQIAGSIKDVGNALKRCARSKRPINWRTTKRGIEFGIYRLFFKSWRNTADAEAVPSHDDVYGTGDYCAWAMPVKALRDALTELRANVGTSGMTEVTVRAGRDGNLWLEAYNDWPSQGKKKRHRAEVVGAGIMTVRSGAGRYGKYDLTELLRWLPVLSLNERAELTSGPNKPIHMAIRAIRLSCWAAPQHE